MIRARTHGTAGRARTRLLAALCAGVAIGALAVATSALGETGASGGTAGASCPPFNPPSMLTLTAGTPQSAMFEQPFATALQVALVSGDGCPVTGAAGVPVTFSGPASGASGLFAGSGSSAATVGSDAAGVVVAPAFTANDAAGGYTVTASSPYGSVSFSLTNTATGTPSKVLAMPLRARSATVAAAYPQPLKARVLDGDGDPVAGATVTFALGSGATGASPCGATSSPGASFLGGGTGASATTDSSGFASSPPITANDVAGSFTAVAAASAGGTTGASGAGNATASSGAIQARFALTNVAGAPAKVTAGVAASESTTAGTRFPIRLAVTVTDAERNPVAGAPVTFTAPADGPDGRFTTRSRGSRHRPARVSHPRVVEVMAGRCGIAVAPPFTAGREQGGYIVQAAAGHARPAAFALVNASPGQLP